MLMLDHAFTTLDPVQLGWTIQLVMKQLHHLLSLIKTDRSGLPPDR